jgi:photosystem II stability/assembly factor-like uncharacterized protein
MSITTFVATTGQGIGRAESTADGSWAVDYRLAEQDVRCLAADPINSDTVYAGTQGNGVLRSDDRSKTWQSAGLSGCIVKSIAVSRLERDTLYAGTKPPMLFVSHDRGTTWTELPAFRRLRSWWWFQPAEMPMTPYVQAIALSPGDPRTLVVGMEGNAVVRSEDAGQTWTHHLSGAVRDCHSMTFHATNGDWIYESGGTGVAISRDGGKTWKQPRDGMGWRYGWACAADPTQPEIWYASASPMLIRSNPGAPAAHIDGKASAYIYRSAGGAPWQKLSGGLPQPLNYMPYALLTDPSEPGHVYAGLSNGDVWHSADHGDTWQQLPFHLKSIQRTLIML